ncbi:MAG: metalloregulator ArsR/SmtB family transcription factor [Alkalispirochaeta sp.]
MKSIDLFQALGDETRYRIVRVLLAAETPLCVAEIVDIVRKPQYAVSRALRRLAATGLVTETQEGKLRFYTPLPVPGAPLQGIFGLIVTDESAQERWPHDLDRLRWRLELRENGKCVVTYTAGYVPEEYKTQEDPMDTEEKRKVLFICVHNTARSQMAEAYLRQFGGDIFDVESAGLTPGTLNPYVVRVLAEDGFDISHKTPQSVFDLYKAGNTYTYVVTVCSREAEEGCPVFPGPVRRLNWPFPDPSRFTGTEEEIIDQTRGVRDQIKEKVREFVEIYREEHHR